MGLHNTRGGNVTSPESNFLVKAASDGHYTATFLEILSSTFVQISDFVRLIPFSLLYPCRDRE